MPKIMLIFILLAFFMSYSSVKVVLSSDLKPLILKRSMHRISRYSFNQRYQYSFSDGLLKKKNVHLLAGKHNDWKSTFSQNTRARPFQYLEKRPSDMGHWGILKVPNCKCNESDNPLEKDMFTAYDRIRCILESNNCWMNNAEFMVHGLCLATHSRKIELQDDGQPLYKLNFNAANEHQKLIFERISRLWVNKNCNRDLSGNPGNQFFFIFKDHIELHFTKEMLCEFSFLNSDFLNTHSKRLYSLIEEIRMYKGANES